MNAPISDNQPVKLTVDNSLIESYNTENGTSFIPFEPSNVSVSTESITAGEMEVNVAYQIDLILPLDFVHDNQDKHHYENQNCQYMRCHFRSLLSYSLLTL